MTIKNLRRELAGQRNKLTVTNSEGSTDYFFKLEMGEKPPAG